MGLKKLVIAGLSLRLLTSCVSFENGLVVNSDCDTNKRYLASRHIYRVFMFDNNKKVFKFGRKLIAIQKDKNKNHIFEENDYIWKEDPREDYPNLD